MNWDEINDPTGEFEFHLGWDFVRGEYSPEGIQELINEKGVQGMVRHVNEYFKMHPHGHPVLRLDRLLSGQPVVVQY